MASGGGGQDRAQPSGGHPQAGGDLDPGQGRLGGDDLQREPAGGRSRSPTPVSGGHFYTMNETEKNKLITTYPDAWTYEDVAWYAFE